MTPAHTTVQWAAVIRKEWLEIRQGARQGRQGLLFQLATQLVGGGIIGSAWQSTLLVSHLTTFGISVMAAGAILPIVGDTIAGERERHTLETVLALPVPITVLLGGKLALLVAYAWMSSLILLVTATATATVIGHALPPVHWDVVGACLTLPLLVAMAFAAVGMLISGRAETARGAQQQLAFVLSAMMLLPLVLFRFVSQSARVGMLAWLQGDALLRIVTLLIAGLALTDVLLVTLLLTHLTRRSLLRAS